MTSYHKLAKDLKEIDLAFVVKNENANQPKKTVSFDSSSSTPANSAKKKNVPNNAWNANLSTSFWEEAVNTTYYTHNRYLVNKSIGKSPYSIRSKKKPIVKHLHVFGSKCFALKDHSKYVDKFDSKYPGLECLDDNEALKFENLNLDSDSEDEDGKNADNIEEETSDPKQHCDDIILVQIYVDDIIFGSTNEKLCQRFLKLMQSEYEMSMMGELSYFLVLQVSQISNEIFISQTKYIKDLLKKFGMVDCSPASNPISTALKLDEDKKGKKCRDLKL
ncbi:hypothetical protein AgCh_025794 [Apium graveolens]